MQTKYLETTETYDGAQLTSLRNYLTHGLLGDSIVAWVGPCDVALDHMVDGEDLRADARIAGDLMLHFILETFDTQLVAAVALQRLFACVVRDELAVPDLRRDGDDLFVGERKLSISIATQSPVNSLIHFAVNVVNEGTPVETCALNDFGIEPRAFAEKVMAAFAREYEGIRQAARKVRWVR